MRRTPRNPSSFHMMSLADSVKERTTKRFCCNRSKPALAWAAESGGRPMSDTLDRRTASRIIHSLAESGQPPKLGASYLNVGTDAMIRRLRSDYMEDLLTS